ncbi:MAG: hypothetical protein ACLUGU_18625 [Alistipes shahii]
MIFTIVVGFVIVGRWDMVLADSITLRRRCPKCHKLTAAAGFAAGAERHAQLSAGGVYVCMSELRRRGETAGPRNLRDDNFGGGSRAAARSSAAASDAVRAEVSAAASGWFLRWRRRRFEMVTIKNG